METDTNNQRLTVKFGNQKINLHIGKTQFLPAAKYPTFGSTDICLFAEGNIAEIKTEVESKGIEIEAGKFSDKVHRKPSGVFISEIRMVI